MAASGPTDQYRLLKPADTVTTLRSLPRRVKAELFGDPQLDMRSLAARRGVAGYNLTGLLEAAATNLERLSESVTRAAVIDGTALPELESPTEASGDFDDAVLRFERVALAAADRLAAIPTSGWRRAGVLSFAQETAREGAETVRRLNGLVAELARRA